MKIKVRRSGGSSIKFVVRPSEVEVYLPEGFDESRVTEVVDRHRMWIEKKMKELQTLAELSCQLEVVDRSEGELRRLIKSYVEQGSREILGAPYSFKKIVIREMNRKWASISDKGVLTINRLAVYLPDEIIRYVVYHEMCHLVEKRHNKKFWACVERVIPDYRSFEKILQAYEIKFYQSGLLSY